MPPRTALLLVLAGLVVTPARVEAQVQPSPPSASYGVRLHVGMWTTHLDDLGRGFDANWLVALGWRGMYGGTFVNSFGDRAFALGVERPLLRRDEGSLAHGLGYRLGLVTGYDERLIGLAGRTPILPVLQLMGDVSAGRTGVEVAWTGKVATMGPFMRMAN